MRKLFLFILIFLFSAQTVIAQSASNNKFGIHIIDENDLEDAARLVNSSGGQWGYVTMVIREDERDHARWQEVFNKMRRLKLIPIIRLATKMEKGIWEIPKAEEANNWAAFLNNLNWPVRRRLVILFNEPNHAKEWGGKIDPAGYAKIVSVYERTLRAASRDFIILPAALDLAAGNTRDTMDATNFFSQMRASDGLVFRRFDGLNSHSYPNPGFSGSIQDVGKKSIRGYIWELEHLSRFGLDPNLPVYITETGWIRISDEEEDLLKLAENYKVAYESVWSDPQVVAVTPFLLNYSGEPFESFAWKNAETGEFYPQYSEIQALEKEKGEPEQIHSFDLEKSPFATKLIANSDYQFKLALKNTGQSIWSDEDGFSLHYESSLGAENIKTGKISITEPGNDAVIPVNIHTGFQGMHSLTLQFNKNGEPIGAPLLAEFEILTPPALEIHVEGWFGKPISDNDYKFALISGDKNILEIEDLLVVDGVVTIPSLYNIIPGEDYKLTIQKDFHLEKTKSVTLSADRTVVYFGRLIPLDLDNSGGVSLGDFAKHISNPLSTQKLVSPF